MRLQTSILSRQQQKQIHTAALRVLNETGVKIEHSRVRDLLVCAGGVENAEGITFSADTIEQHIAQTPKTPLDERQAVAKIHSEVIACKWLDPLTGVISDFTETRLAQFADFSNHLSTDCWASLHTLPFETSELPFNLSPLGEKTMAWKWGYFPQGSVIDTVLCQPILDLFTARASHQGKKIAEVFNACGFLVSPLRLARTECEQMLFFHDRGLEMGIGQMPIQGATAPATLAGTLTLTIAEELFMLILRRAFGSSMPMVLGGTPQTMDMRSALACFGRPQRNLITVALADMARFYGCGRATHSGLSDAMIPGAEATFQKSTSALMAILSSGKTSVAGGLLGVDEVCSPIQLFLDVQMVNALNQMLQMPEFTEADCSVESITEVGPGGSFLGTMETLMNHPQSLPIHEPWNFRSLSSWQAAGSPTDMDAARESFRIFVEKWEPQPRISAEEEADYRSILKNARTLATSVK